MKKKWYNKGNNYRTATEKVWGVGSDKIVLALCTMHQLLFLKSTKVP